MKQNLKLMAWLFLAMSFGYPPASGQDRQPMGPVSPVVVNFRELARLAPSRPDATAEPRAIHRPFMAPRNLPVPRDAQMTRTVVPPLPAETEAAPAPRIPDPFVAGFEALPDNVKFIPPDTNGAIGPNHVVTALNPEVRIQDRNGGHILTVTLDAFWASAGANGVFDPRLLYDPISKRWLISAVAGAVDASSSVLLGGSQTSDPTGLWNLYRFDADAADLDWADFPLLGFNQNWAVVSVNMFPIANSNGWGAKVFVVTRTDLYAGASLSPRVFTATRNSAFTLAPATSYDSPSQSFYLVEDWNGNLGGEGHLRLSKIQGPVGAETFQEGVGFIKAGSTWTWQALSENSAPQLGTVKRIAVNDSRMGNCVQRFQSIWCAQHVFIPAGLPNRTAVQWWQFDPVSLAVQQFGRVEDPTTAGFFAFPSIAVNRSRDVLIGYSVFSPDIHASSGFSFRYGSDAPSTLRAYKIHKPGQAPYYKTYGGSLNRWGDYSSTVLDPLDDVTLWTIQEYAWLPTADFPSLDRWSTWWLRVYPGRLLLPAIYK